jgi:hypothetical protein
VLLLGADLILLYDKAVLFCCVCCVRFVNIRFAGCSPSPPKYNSNAGPADVKLLPGQPVWHSTAEQTVQAVAVFW